MRNILLIKGSICSWKRVFKLPFQLFFPNSVLFLLLGTLRSWNYSVLDQDLPVNFGKMTQMFPSTFGPWQPGVQQGRLSTRWEPLNSNGCWPLWQWKHRLRPTVLHPPDVQGRQSSVPWLDPDTPKPKSCLLRLLSDWHWKNRDWAANNAYFGNINSLCVCHIMTY